MLNITLDELVRFLIFIFFKNMIIYHKDSVLCSIAFYCFDLIFFTLLFLLQNDEIFNIQCTKLNDK